MPNNPFVETRCDLLIRRNSETIVIRDFIARVEITSDTNDVWDRSGEPNPFKDTRATMVTLHDLKLTATVPEECVTMEQGNRHLG